MSTAVCLSALSAALIFIWNWKNRQTWFSFPKFILIDLSFLPFVGDRCMFVLSLMLMCLICSYEKTGKCFVSSQAPHVSRSVEDETKYIELMVINDHLMVSV